MILSYRTRRILRGLAIALLSLILVAALVWLVWLFWLDRFVVYSRDGVKLDFQLSAQIPPGQLAVPPEPGETVAIYYSDGEDLAAPTTELTLLDGYYIDAALLEDMNSLRTQLSTLAPGTPVMVDVKNIQGYCFYSSTVGPVSESVDTAAFDGLIRYLQEKDFYTIARLPAFRDRYYGLNHDTYGIPHSSGGYLWMDEESCYWLNPDSEGTMAYLTSLADELKAKGFDEVVFTEFRFPDTENILYNGDKTASLNTAAGRLVAACASDTFAVSFCVDLAVVNPQEGRSRLYAENIPAGSVESVAESFTGQDPTVNLVFLVSSSDTRYDGYSTLRPLDFAYGQEPGA